MDRGGLRDDEWDRIKDFLPGREGHVGGTAPDNRRVRRRGSLPLSDGHSLARFAGAFWFLEKHAPTLQPMVQERCFRSCSEALGWRRRRRIRDDRRHDRARASTQRRGAKKGRGPGHRTFQGNVYGRSGTYAYGRSGTYAYGNTANYGYGRSGYAYGYGSWRHRYWAPYGVYAYSNSNSSGCYYTYKYSNRQARIHARSGLLRRVSAAAT